MTVPRRKARAAAFGVVFAAISSGKSAAESLAQQQSAAPGGRERAVFDDALTVAVAAAFDSRRGDIEKLLEEKTRRPPEHISVAERAVMSAAIAEFFAAPQTGEKIVINEAVEIAKKYGAEGGYKLVNAVLDSAARDLRGE